jgi:aspartate/methionine/tyrosine aminotransferase/DNA-binding CsgD family transcriptional regulator
LKDAVVAALRSGHNQYAVSHGEPELRRAVAAHAGRFYGVAPDPDTEVTVTNGAAEALHSILDALIDPGDEVVLLEPSYEAYAPNVIMAGGVPRFVPLRPPGWAFDPGELAAAFTGRTRAVILNTPHNPTGKVFTRGELEVVAELCRRHDVIALSDEVYEHLVYDGRHVRLTDLPGMAERTLTIGSMSKTYSYTGWRIGWVIAAPELSRAVRLAHQFVLDCSATPMQYAAARALSLGDDYYAALAAGYRGKRDFLAEALRRADGLGAVWLAGLTSEELKVAGGRRRRRRLDELTPQEERVAHAAAAGRQNAELAQQLSVSVNTIETHLRHIYAKLGIRSRSELAARMAEGRQNNGG